MSKNAARPEGKPPRRARPAVPVGSEETLPVKPVAVEPHELAKPLPSRTFQLETPGDKMAFWSGLLAILPVLPVVGQILGVVLAVAALRGRAGAVGWKRWLAWGALVVNAFLLLLTAATVVGLIVLYGYVLRQLGQWNQVLQ